MRSEGLGPPGYRGDMNGCRKDRRMSKGYYSELNTCSVPLAVDLDISNCNNKDFNNQTQFHLCHRIFAFHISFNLHEFYTIFHYDDE